MEVPMRFLSLGLTLFLCMAGIAMAKQNAYVPGDHALNFTSSLDSTQQPYRLFVPRVAEEGKSLPLLFVLHGKWVDQNAWFNGTPIKNFAQLNGYLVVAPYSRGNLFYRGAGEQDVMDLLKLTQSQFNVDSNRIYVMGHSMGGWGTWWLGLRHPDVFAAMAPMSGWAPPYLLPNAKWVPPYIVHSADDPIVSVEGSRSPERELTRLSIPHLYTEETSYGHDSRMIGDHLDRVFTWFKNHPKSARPDPDKITHRPKRLAVAKPYGKVAEWSDESTFSKTPVVLCDTVARYLLSETKGINPVPAEGADLCLFQDDMFEWPVGELTTDKLLDIYLYPIENVAVVKVSRNELEAMLKKMDSDPSPLVRMRTSPSGSIPNKDSLVILTPSNIARYFTDKPVLMDRTIGEYLTDAIARSGSFPNTKK